MSLKVTASAPENSRHSQDVVTLLFHNDHLLSGADDGKIKIWTRSLELVAEIAAHPVNVYSLAAIGDTIYSCSNDGTVKAWNFGTWDAKKTLMDIQPSEIIKLCSDEGKLYAGSDVGDVYVFDNEELTATYSLHEDISDFLVIGSLVFNARNVDVSVFQMMGGPRFNYMSRGAMIGRFPIRRIGDKVVFLSRCAKEIYVHMASREEKFKRLGGIKAHDMTISAMSPIPGKPNLFASGGYDRILKVWDTGNSNKLVAKLDVGVGINEIAPGPEKQLFISGSEGYISRVDVNI